MFELIVGNIGQVYHGSSEAEARELYKLYVSKSQAKDGRAADEDVTLFKDGEPILEHQGEKETD